VVTLSSCSKATPSCCTKDAELCGGINNPCTGDQYLDIEKNGNTKKGADPAKTCCTPKTTCDKVKCNPGMKPKTSGKCAGAADSSTCKNSCCEVDTKTCIAYTCPMGKFQDPSKWGTLQGSTAATACCTEESKCDKVKCPAATKKKALAGFKCKGAVNSATCLASCCEADSNYCGGIANPCGLAKMFDKTKSGTLKGNTPATTCCRDKLKCKDYWAAAPAAASTASTTAGLSVLGWLAVLLGFKKN